MKITREVINILMLLHETINSTAESYFHSCRFPCASQCVLELQVLSGATDKGTYLMNTINNIFLMVYAAIISLLHDSEDRSFNVRY